MVRRRGGPRVAFDRLRAPGDGDIRDRIEAVYAAVDGLSAEDLNLAPPPVFDLTARGDRVSDAEILAEEHGRGALLDTARDRLQDALLRRWTSRLTLAYGMESIQTGRVEDRAAIVTALRDLVAAAVLRDLLDPAAFDALAADGLRIVGVADFEELDALTAAGDDGFDADEDADEDEADEGSRLDDEDDGPPDTDILGGQVSSPGRAGTVDPGAASVPERILRAGDPRSGAPSADDWAEADRAARDGAASFRPDPISLVLGAFAVIGLFSVLAMRVERGSVVSGLVLVAALLLAVFVVFRLWSRRRG